MVDLVTAATSSLKGLEFWFLLDPCSNSALSNRRPERWWHESLKEKQWNKLKQVRQWEYICSRKGGVGGSMIILDYMHILYTLECCFFFPSFPKPHRILSELLCGFWWQVLLFLKQSGSICNVLGHAEDVELKTFSSLASRSVRFELLLVPEFKNK